jgi:hypothetical protein
MFRDGRLLLLFSKGYNPNLCSICRWIFRSWTSNTCAPRRCRSVSNCDAPAVATDSSFLISEFKFPSHCLQLQREPAISAYLARLFEKPRPPLTRTRGAPRGRRPRQFSSKSGHWDVQAAIGGTLSIVWYIIIYIYMYNIYYIIYIYMCVCV